MALFLPVLRMERPFYSLRPVRNRRGGCMLLVVG
jgi:hypothetical protein